MTRRRLVLASAFGLLLATSTLGVALAQGGQLGGKLLTGNQVTIPSGETVDHDIYAFAGTVDISGTVNGDVVAAGGNVAVNGPVNGDVVAAGGTAGSVGAYSRTGTITGTDSITVTGNQAATVTPAPSNPIVDAIRQFIVVFVVAILALWLVPRAMRSAEGWVRERPLPSLGWGFVAFVLYFVLIILVVIASILLAIIFGALGFGSLVGIDIFGAFVVCSAITLALVIVAAFLADAIVGLAVARLVMGRTSRAPGGDWSLTGRDRWTDLGLIAVGVAIVVVLTSLPVIGGLVKLGVVLLALGALWLAWRQGRMVPPAIVATQPPPAAPPPTPSAPAAPGVP
jgi:hypothetical protein